MIQVYIDICLPSTKSIIYLFFFLAWIMDRTYSNSLHIKIYNIPKKYDSFSCKALRIWTLIGKEKR